MDLCERRARTAVGTRHPWESARAAHVNSLLKRYAGTRHRLLDVGSGDSFVALSVLEVNPELTEALCVDIHYNAEDLAEDLPDDRARRTTVVPSGSYDLLLLLDVIEHVQDSTKLLRSLRERAVSPDAVALVTVPAHQQLFSDHDRALGHHRRYSSLSLRQELEDAGWQVQELGGFFVLPFIARVLQMIVTSVGPSVDGRRRVPRDLGEWHHRPRTTAVTRLLLLLDAALARACHRSGLRTIGLSWWAIATPRAHVQR